jgi:hypothetical protein
MARNAKGSWAHLLPKNMKNEPCLYASDLVPPLGQSDDVTFNSVTTNIITLTGTTNDETKTQILARDGTTGIVYYRSVSSITTFTGSTTSGAFTISGGGDSTFWALERRSDPVNGERLIYNFYAFTLTFVSDDVITGSIATFLVPSINMIFPLTLYVDNGVEGAFEDGIMTITTSGDIKISRKGGLSFLAGETVSHRMEAIGGVLPLAQYFVGKW